MNLNVPAMVVAGLCTLAASGGAWAQASLLPGGSSKEPVSINATKLDYFDKEQKLVYSGGVFAKQGDSTLKSTTLSIFLASSPTKGASSGGGDGAPGSNDVKRMEATGPVTISSKDQVGMGDQAIYDKAENKLYLIGNVSLSQEGNVIKGQPKSRLIYDLTSGQAHIEGGVTSLFTPKNGGGDKAAGSGGGTTGDGLRRGTDTRDSKETRPRRP
jgi:lipopolysaccharide export system protein LptA